MTNLFSASSYDNGSCCGLATGFNAYLYTPDGAVKSGTTGTAGTNVTATGPNLISNAFACVAFANVRNGTTDA
jgi:hypothetical protein